MRPDYLDVLVLTVGTKIDPVMAGAKYPIAKARFPFQFSLYSANILPTKQSLWLDISDDDDLLVTARVCPDNSPTFPCTDQQSTFLTKGISKLIRDFPGTTEPIRTPVALPLEPQQIN